MTIDRRWSFRLLALLASAALAVALGAGVPDASGAGKKKANVKVKIKVTDATQPAPDSFSGRVLSPKPYCTRPGRKVTLFYGDEPVASDTLDKDGRYLMGIANPHPNVLPFTVRIKKTKRCQAATSAPRFAE